MNRHDISDDKWKIISPFLARKPKDPRGRPPQDDRLMLNAFLWIVNTGAPWRDLPKEFGAWQTAYKRFAKWAKLAAWDDILNFLTKDADPETILIDSSYVKLHQHGSGAKGGTSISK